MSYMKAALLIAQSRGIENPTLEQLAAIAQEERDAGRWPLLFLDAYLLPPDALAGIKLGVEALQAGKITPWEEVERELGLEEHDA